MNLIATKSFPFGGRKVKPGDVLVVYGFRAQALIARALAKAAPGAQADPEPTPVPQAEPEKPRNKGGRPRRIRMEEEPPNKMQQPGSNKHGRQAHR